MRYVGPSYGEVQEMAGRDTKVQFTVWHLIKHAWIYGLAILVAGGIAAFVILTHHSCPKGKMPRVVGGKKTCAQCVTNKNCGHGTVCGPGGNCVACVDNSTCPNGVCDLKTNTCTITCSNDGDCAGAGAAGPVCDTETNRCVVCVTDAGCTNPAAPFCLSNNTCGECTVGNHCGDGRTCKDPSGGSNPVCLTTCSATSDCPDATPLCVDGVCLVCDPSKVNSGVCKGNTSGPYCAANGMSCGACSTDSDCKTQWNVCTTERTCERIGGANALTTTLKETNSGWLLEGALPSGVKVQDAVPGSTRLTMQLSAASDTPQFMFIPSADDDTKWAMLATPSTAQGQGTEFIAAVYGCCGPALSFSTTCSTAEGTTTCGFAGSVEALVLNHPYSAGLQYPVHVVNAADHSLVERGDPLPSQIKLRIAGLAGGSAEVWMVKSGGDNTVRWSSTGTALVFDVA